VPTSVPARDSPAETAPAVTLAADDDTGDGPSTAPILAATVAAGVIGLAGILAWTRLGSRRVTDVRHTGYDTWT
jgi:hypothetical protein